MVRIMAKKKVSRVASKEQQTQQKSSELSRQCSMEDHDPSEEKFQNLKSLNAILLKQTMEKRQQIESLVQAKEALEAELARSGSENFQLKLEMDLFMGFVESRVKEMGFAVDGLVKETGGEIRDLKREASGLTGKLESERRELSRVSGERDSLKSGFDLQMRRLGEERKKQEELIETVNKDKSKTKKILEEVDELKTEIKGLFKEIESVKRDRNEKVVELMNLNETVRSLTKEEEGLRGKFIGFVTNLDEVIKESKAKEEHISTLVKEKSIKESELEGLLMENTSIKKKMEMAVMQFHHKEKLVDQLLLEKNEQTHVAVQWQKDHDNHAKTIQKLSCDVSQLKDALVLVEVERDNAGKALVEEKRNRAALKEKLMELEKMIEATGRELENIKADRGRLIKEKKDLENRSESLRNDKAILQKDIVELKKAMSVLKTEVDSVGTNAKHGLTKLKTVSSLVCESENKKGDQKREKGMDSYSVEVEAIRKAFKNKESMVEDMKKEVENMKHLVEDVQKKKSFWTLVSSVTTLFMAASVAYAASIK